MILRPPYIKPPLLSIEPDLLKFLEGRGALPKRAVAAHTLAEKARKLKRTRSRRQAAEAKAQSLKVQEQKEEADLADCQAAWDMFEAYGIWNECLIDDFSEYYEKLEKYEEDGRKAIFAARAIEQDFLSKRPAGIAASFGNKRRRQRIALALRKENFALVGFEIAVDGKRRLIYEEQDQFFDKSVTDAALRKAAAAQYPLHPPENPYIRLHDQTLFYNESERRTRVAWDSGMTPDEVATCHPRPRLRFGETADGMIGAVSDPKRSASTASEESSGVVSVPFWEQQTEQPPPATGPPH
jgi:hypothetical protein